ncbi:MAG: hypothetical protein ACI4C1_05065 [Lachnospiraceae bacterium]
MLKVASEQVPFGVFAVECGDYAELRNDKCSSRGQLKRIRSSFKQQGFKVLYNG